MIKIVYVGEDDYMAYLKRGDILFAEPTEDGLGYFAVNTHGEEVYVAKHEAVELNG